GARRTRRARNARASRSFGPRRRAPSVAERRRPSLGSGLRRSPRRTARSPRQIARRAFASCRELVCGAMCASDGQPRSLLLHFLPAGCGIEARHHVADSDRALAEVLLVDLALVAHDERHHAAFTVLRGVRDEAEAGDHAPVDDVVVRAAGRALALPGEDFEVVAAVGVAFLVPFEISGTLGDQRPERTALAILGDVVRPIEP